MGVSLSPPIFHPKKGSLVTVTQNNKTATRNNATQEFNHGLVLSSFPLQDNQACIWYIAYCFLYTEPVVELLGRSYASTFWQREGISVSCKQVNSQCDGHSDSLDHLTICILLKKKLLSIINYTINLCTLYMIMVSTMSCFLFPRTNRHVYCCFSTRR